MTPHQVLHAIEVDAERAIAQELAVMMQDVQTLRPVLEADDRDYADCLLLKLDQLIRNQQLVPPVGNAQADVSVTVIEAHCSAISSPVMEEVEDEVLSAA
jgi:hypothetical protein